MNIQLLPTPKSLKLTQGQVSTSGMAVRETISSSLVPEQGDEAYHLEITTEGAFLTARSEKGLRWGRATLAQLCQANQIPCLVIDDAPLFAERGLMLDISRNRIPKMDTLFDLVDKMASWKMNHLQLYVEHSFAYCGHETVWRSVSPITPEEMKTLDRYCSAKGILLHANQNCLGHFEKWLRHPEYLPLAERSKGRRLETLNSYRPPNTLCPIDPKVHQLIDDLLGQLLPLCSGAYANIGCDEPWDLGTGRSKDVCQERGKATLFSEYVARVAKEAQKHGKTPQFWCDPHPNENDALPKDIIALIWQYEANGNFSERVASHRKQGRAVWVAPGTSCHNTFNGRTWNRRGNFRMAVAEDEAEGFLCTSWGDAGHRQAWPLTLIGFAEAAQACWAGHMDVTDETIGQMTFGSPKIGTFLSELGNVDQELCRGERPSWGEPVSSGHLFNQSALWQEMNTPLHVQTGRGDVAAWEEVHERLKVLKQTLNGQDSSPYLDECHLSIDVCQWTAERALLRRTELTKDNKADLADKIVDTANRFRKQWLDRFRYGELEDSTRQFLNVMAGLSD